MLHDAGLSTAPAARVAVFVGNAWDPQEGREAPWVDVARQLAGDRGVELLGPQAATTPPGTEALGRVFAAAGAPVLVLFDEVLNFINRYRQLADPFHAFIQNLTVAMTGTTHGAAVISLPRSQVEMSDFDLAWQDKITKVVRRVAKDLIANDETEVSEVVRRRLFDHIGEERFRKRVSRLYADWCFERRERLPAQWTLVDSAATEAKAREHLRARFEACYPFHPATLSVFQQKWNALPQFQQTRGTLAMLAQWISWAHRDGFTRARTEPLITLGSAPLDVADFAGVVLGQLGESRLSTAIDADIAGVRRRTRAPWTPTARPRSATSTGAWGRRCCSSRRAGRWTGWPICPSCASRSGSRPSRPHPSTARRWRWRNAPTSSAGSARTASGSATGRPSRRWSTTGGRRWTRKARSGRPSARWSTRTSTGARPFPRVFFPADAATISDTPKLTLVVMDPEAEWTGAVDDDVRQRALPSGPAPGALRPACTRAPSSGRSGSRAGSFETGWSSGSPGSVWPARSAAGTLGSELDRADRADIAGKVREAADAAREEVWGGYRFVVIADTSAPDGLKVIDLGAGHSSSSESLCGRVISALKSSALLNESVGAGYLERNWPPALKEDGAWPLVGLRQCFLDGSLTRLVDPDAVLRRKIVEFVGKGDFGLGSGTRAGGRFERWWFREPSRPRTSCSTPTSTC